MLTCFEFRHTNVTDGQTDGRTDTDDCMQGLRLRADSCAASNEFLKKRTMVMHLLC